LATKQRYSQRCWRIQLEVNKMTTEKKPWSQPQLIVLDRGLPEETVLIVCKFIKANAPSNGAKGQCLVSDPNTNGCMTCDVPTPT
jgi:hypothetical protein